MLNKVAGSQEENKNNNKTKAFRQERQGLEAIPTRHCLTYNKLYIYYMRVSIIWAVNPRVAGSLPDP